MGVCRVSKATSAVKIAFESCRDVSSGGLVLLQMLRCFTNRVMQQDRAVSSLWCDRRQVCQSSVVCSSSQWLHIMITVVEASTHFPLLVIYPFIYFLAVRENEPLVKSLITHRCLQNGVKRVTNKNLVSVLQCYKSRWLIRTVDVFQQHVWGLKVIQITRCFLVKCRLSCTLMFIMFHESKTEKILKY